MVVLPSPEKYRYALAALEPTAAHDRSRQYLDHNAVPAGEYLRPQEDSDEEGPSGDEDAFDDVEMPEMIRGTAENNNFEDQQRDEQREKYSAGSTITEGFGSTISIPDRTSETTSLSVASSELPVSTSNRFTTGISEYAGAESTDPRSPDVQLAVPKQLPLFNPVQPTIASIGGVEVLRLPKARPKKSTRKAPKQGKPWATRPKRLAVVVWLDSTVKRRDLFVWRECVMDLEFVRMTMDAYPLNMTDKIVEWREPTATHETTAATLLDHNFVVPKGTCENYEAGDPHPAREIRKERKAEAST
ncbi:hypothetical protein GN958_ATG18189 [Phytophthora infestans]|uniref:Uncharacterized protein n=1 Tax=Phytophthora infestans TaxID=4787 RepID=A0A8S9TYM3_PHYIN|nr:hypothetical protein GN958_ATG18189 [Phytophthora infestans]